MGGLSGANPYLARALTNDLARQAKVAQEKQARAERARLDEADLGELEREPKGQAPVTPDRRRPFAWLPSRASTEIGKAWMEVAAFVYMLGRL